MCEICRTVESELLPVIEQLKAKYPGTSVEGHKVPVGHHVYAAVTNIAGDLAVEEGKALVAIEAEKRGITVKEMENQLAEEFAQRLMGNYAPKAKSSIFSGGSKVIEA